MSIAHSNAGDSKWNKRNYRKHSTGYAERYICLDEFAQLFFNEDES